MVRIPRTSARPRLVATERAIEVIAASTGEARVERRADGTLSIGLGQDSFAATVVRRTALDGGIDYTLFMDGGSSRLRLVDHADEDGQRSRRAQHESGGLGIHRLHGSTFPDLFRCTGTICAGSSETMQKPCQLHERVENRRNSHRNRTSD